MSRILGILLTLIFLIPILILILIATLDTKQFGLFSQERVGKNGKLFNLYKIRTLLGNYKSSITTSKMKKSNIGKFLRQYHLDEIPQIINIAFGQMAFVGPRPDLKKYYDLLSPENYKQLTNIKPGLFGICQLNNLNEELLLSKQSNPEEYYEKILWKEKVLQNINYQKHRTNFSDLNIIIKTIIKICKNK